MTAILAFAAPGIAFVAGDTKRVTAAHPATKVHRWSSSVVFAQAGNGAQLSALIGQMMAFRPILGEDLDGLKCAFSQLRQHFHDQALAAQAASRTPQHVDTNGILLVADAESGEVISLDFAGGPFSLPRIPFGTAGAAAIAGAATSAWAVSRPALDLWAITAIDACVGATVDWPIDLLITRPKDQDGSLTIQRRYEHSLAARSDPAFLA